MICNTCNEFELNNTIKIHKKIKFNGSQKNNKNDMWNKNEPSIFPLLLKLTQTNSLLFAFDKNIKIFLTKYLFFSCS